MISDPKTPESPNSEILNSFEVVDRDNIANAILANHSKIDNDSSSFETLKILENLGLSHRLNKKKLLFFLLSDNPPKYIESSFLYRADSIRYNGVLGTFICFQVKPKYYSIFEATNHQSSKLNYNPNSINFLIWIAYESLMVINKRFVTHTKSNGELVVHVKYQFEEEDGKYISAKLTESGMNLEETLFDKIPKLNQAIIIPFNELHSLDVNNKEHGFTSIHLFQEFYSNVLETSRKESKSIIGPFLFQDGGCQNFIDQLDNHFQLNKIPNQSIIYLKEKNFVLDHSIKRMDLDDYFKDVLREDGSSGARGIFEWGAKLSKEVNNLQAGFKKIFTGKKDETREALKKIQAERKSKIEIEQRIISNPDSELIDDDDYGFEIIDYERPSNKFPQWSSDLSNAITLEEWRTKWFIDGTIKNPEQLKNEIFFRGIKDEVRPEIWPFLLGYYSWDSTFSTRNKLREDAKKEYEIYLNQWSSITPRQAEKHSLYTERLHRIEKDVVRTDRSHPLFADEDSEYLKIIHRILMSYAFYNFDLGYCQGMGDILSPILAVIKDEVLTFWCYTTWMDKKVNQNFRTDSSGMESQLQYLISILRTLDYEFYTYLEANDSINLFFCFRWILVVFKREFDFESTKRIWECLWTNKFSDNLHLFMCYAILQLHRDTIMKQNMKFDDILQYFIDLSQKLNLQQIMKKTIDCICEFEQLRKSISESTLLS